MFYLINRANVEGTCFPSVKTIASDCGVSERTVQRTMKVLLEEGFVVKENRYRDNGGQSSNLYKLQIEPESNSDKQSNGNEKRIKEETIELHEGMDDNFEIIKIVTFDDYIGVNETKENDLNNEDPTVLNTIVPKAIQGDIFAIKPKCHPVSFQCKAKKYDANEIVTPSIFQCHGVGDNLYPP